MKVLPRRSGAEFGSINPRTSAMSECAKNSEGGEDEGRDGDPGKKHQETWRSPMKMDCQDSVSEEKGATNGMTSSLRNPIPYGRAAFAHLLKMMLGRTPKRRTLFHQGYHTKSR